MSLLEVENMRVRYGAYEVLKGVNFALREGEWLMVIGPNGAGKSTIVKAVSQSTPYTGQVLFAGEDVRQMRPSHLARRLGVLMQNHAVGYSFTGGRGCGTRAVRLFARRLWRKERGGSGARGARVGADGAAGAAPSVCAHAVRRRIAADVPGAGIRAKPALVAAGRANKPPGFTLSETDFRAHSRLAS